MCQCLCSTNPVVQDPSFTDKVHACTVKCVCPITDTVTVGKQLNRKNLQRCSEQFYILFSYLFIYDFLCGQLQEKNVFLKAYLMKEKIIIKENTKTPETGFDHPRLPCVCFSISAVIPSTLSSCHSLCAPADCHYCAFASMSVICTCVCACVREMPLYHPFSFGIFFKRNVVKYNSMTNF